MKKYYNAKYNDYGYKKIFNDYNVVYNGLEIFCFSDFDYDSKSDYIKLIKRKFLSNKIAKSVYIPIIIEYDTCTKRYADIITGEEYAETVNKNSMQYLVNKGGNLEIFIYHQELSVTAVANILKRLSPSEIEAYSIAMDNLKKAANERVRIINEEKRNSENYIEAFKRNRKK